jgi:hypothetical protein
VAGHLRLTAQFNVQLGRDLTIPATSYLVLYQLSSIYGSGLAGPLSLILSGGRAHTLHLVYYDVNDVEHYLYSRANLRPAKWHTIDLQWSMDPGHGALSLYVNGLPAILARHLALDAHIPDPSEDSFGLPYQSCLGMEWSPIASATAGHIYVDDVIVVTSSIFMAQGFYNWNASYEYTGGVSDPPIDHDLPRANGENCILDGGGKAFSLNPTWPKTDMRPGRQGDSLATI